MSNNPTLFDAPTARHSDPLTSHEAAHAIKSADELTKAIRAFVWAHGACTAFEVADALRDRPPYHWQESTIRSAMNPHRSGLVMFPGGETPRGRSCSLYGLPTETVWDREHRI